MANPNVDGSVVVGVELDDKESMKELNRLKREIRSLEKSIEDMRIRRSPLAEEMNEYAAQLDKAKAKLAELKYLQKQDEAILSSGGIGQYDEYMRAYERQGEIAADISKQEAEVKRLEKAWGDVSQKVKEYDSRIAYAQEKLEKSEIKAGEFASNVVNSADAQTNMAQATDKARKSMSKFSMRVKEVIRSALVFTVISQAFASLREWFGKAAKTNKELVASLSRLKGEALTLAQLFIDKILPALSPIADMISDAINKITKLLAPLFGVTAEEARENAEALYNETQGLEKLEDAAKKADKALASFDEINRLSSLETGSESGQFGEIKPNFDENAADSTIKAVDKLKTYLAGALFAVGAVLAFSGASVGLGLGMMVVGGAELADQVSENWGSLNALLEKYVWDIIGGAGALMFVAGAILTLSGAHLLMGISLMVAGFSAVAVTVSLNDGQLSEMMQKTIGELMGASGVLLFVSGLILALSGGSIVKGISLMAAGALSVVAAVEVSWGALNPETQNAVAAIVGTASVVMFAAGLILALTGVNIAIGIALMATGGLAIVSAVTTSWGALNEDIRATCEAIANLGGGVLFGAGLILALTGVKIALGIAMIAAGAALMFTPSIADWASGRTSIGDAVNSILKIGGALLLVAGLLLALTGVGVGVGLGLMLAGVTSGVVANWGTLTGQIGEEVNQVMAVGGSILLVAGLALLAAGVSAGVGLALIAAGGFALYGSLSGSESKSLSSEIPAYAQYSTENNADKLEKKKQEYFDRMNDPTVAGKGNSMGSYYSSYTGQTLDIASGKAFPQSSTFSFTDGASYSVDVGTTSASRQSDNSTVVLELDGKEVGRAVFPSIQRESRRLGVNLVK